MLDKEITKNSVANFISRMWAIVSVYVFIPLYISVLGEEAYGLVSFFSTLQATMNILGLGLSSTLRREFATGENDGKNRIYKYKLLKSTEMVYGFIAIIVILITFFGSQYLANGWLNLDTLNPYSVSITITLMGVSIGVQLLTNLYHGCLLGLNYQLTANIYYLLWSSLKCIGSALIIIYIAPNLILFYTYYIVCDLFYFTILRFAIISKLKEKSSMLWSFRDLINLKLIWKYTLGLFLISIISVVTRQLDKAIISKELSLTELGAYNLVITLGQLSSIVTSALSITLFTKFTNLFSLKKNDELNNSFLRYNRILALVILCLGSFISVYANELMLFWTNSESIIKIIGNTSVVIILGTTALSLQELPYSYVLAQGDTKINNILGIVSLPFLIISPYLAIRKWGLLGAGISYFGLMSIQTTIYYIMIFKKYIRMNYIKWMFHNLLLPFMVSLTIAVASKRLIDVKTDILWQKIVFAVFSGAVTLFLMLILKNYKVVKNILLRIRNNNKLN